jgi:hypothetical protein
VVLALVALTVTIAAVVASVLTRDDSAPDAEQLDRPSSESMSSLESEPSAAPSESPPEPSSPSTQAAPPEAAPTTEITSETLFEGDRVRSVIEEIAVARGADPLRVLRLVIYPEYLFADVQDPAIPENVDEYQWRGELRAAEPVRLVGVEDLETSLFSADEVDWSAIASLVAGAPQAVQIDDGEVTHAIVERPLPFSTDIRIRVFVVGARASSFVDADANGTVIAIDGQATGAD